LYRSRYHRQAVKRKEIVPKLNDKEILLELSITQKELSETYRLKKKTAVLDLVANQYKYVAGTNTYEIPKDILDINLLITYDAPVESGGFGFDFGFDFGWGGEIEFLSSYGVPNFIAKASIADIGNISRCSGNPSRYAFHDEDDDSTLWINSLPAGYDADRTSRLFMIYNQKMFLFYDSEDNNNSTWSDYDPTASDYGGSFKLPNQFHSLIVEGALATAFPELMNNYMLKVNQMVHSKPVSVSGNLRYQLGGLS